MSKNLPALRTELRLERTIKALDDDDLLSLIHLIEVFHGLLKSDFGYAEWPSQYPALIKAAEKRGLIYDPAQ